MTTPHFQGRESELASLQALKRLRKASLVAVTGRRRIGKSALIQHFAKEYPRFYEFQGIPPRTGINNDSQLKNFAELLRQRFGGAEPRLSNWTEAFDQLGKELGGKPALVFLDELSWMGKFDPDFPGKLKIAWDTVFSRISGMCLVVCGSVSSWIEENILRSTDFVGRVSLVLRLRELGMKQSLHFWGEKATRISVLERLSYLCVTGGIPKYLEEYDITQSTAHNVKRLCFTDGGYLFEDFERIFSDIFEKKSSAYRAIVQKIVSQPLEPQKLADQLGIGSSGEFFRSLHDLEMSGFISRQYRYKPGGERSKLSTLRISDNYLRFYLRYVEPNKNKIRAGLFKFNDLNSLIAWDTIAALQFENLVLNRLPEIIKALGLDEERIISAAPYFQTKTTKTRACQIDLLIECKPSNFYVCEMKFQKHLTTKVISEMQTKLNTLKLPKYSSRHPVLIFAGELDSQIRDADYFDKILDLGAFL